MACPLCGELCTCAVDRRLSSARGGDQIAPHVAVLIDPESLAADDASEQCFEASLEQAPAAGEASVAEVPLSEVAGMLASEAAPTPPVMSSPAPLYRPDDSAWRQEVSSRVDNFRTRRRGRYDSNSSLSLNFDSELEGEERPQAQPLVNDVPKVIEFPRPAAPPVVEELAEPVVEKPRILEAEEQPEEVVMAAVAAPPVPSITLEPAAAEVARAHGPEQEVLLWIAPPSQRIFAGLVDGLVVATATGLFGLIFLRMTGAALTGRVAAGLALALPGFFWALYQYIFLVYGGTTPGLQMTGLRLTAFDGGGVPRRLRRWRALAMMVSYASLGLGFLWAVVDEDGLGWHDRITRTCVRE